MFIRVGISGLGAIFRAADEHAFSPRGWGLAIFLAACRTSQPLALPEARPATSASSAPSPPSTPTGGANSAAEPPHAHPHAAEHDHGRDGYHMDFSEVERFARHFDSPDRDAWQKPGEVVRLADLRAGQTVADIGAGTGYFLSYWSKAVGERGRVLALDVEPNMVEYMKRRVRQNGWANVEPRLVVPDDPNLPPSSVDRIVIVDTWHHIDDRSAYGAKLARALKPAGFVLIVDFTLDSDIGPPASHRLPPQEVVSELEASGLRAQIVEAKNLPKQYVVRGAKP